jgi:D-glutamate cyclase
MTTDEKLAAILAAVQTDPGNRGLAKVPGNNLFTATAGDFEAACFSLAESSGSYLDLVTGFYIPTASPPAYETDGPLGCVFLMRSLIEFFPAVSVGSPHGGISRAMRCGLESTVKHSEIEEFTGGHYCDLHLIRDRHATTGKHSIVVEHVGRASNGKYYSMRGIDISEFTEPIDSDFLPWDRNNSQPKPVTIGIGDGGNEIGMGKIPHETIVANIPNGDLIHCRVPTDHLIVAGVSNWGAYALAAGVFVLKGVTPPADLFDPDREREILEVMVREGPLVDGVTGQQTATVDGLSWDEYAKPLVRIREILAS